MSLDKTNADLEDRFRKPLSEYTTRRIIFWKDVDGKYSEFVDTLEIPGVKIHKLTGANNFQTKYLLEKLDTQSNYLIYDPIHYDKPSDNWLCDMELYCEEFRADYFSQLMEELQIPAKPNLRSAVKDNAKFFESKERRQKYIALGHEYNHPNDIQYDILAVLVGAKKSDAASIMAAVLTDSRSVEENHTLEKIQKFGDASRFWKMVQAHTGYAYDNNPSLLPLAAHILLSALSKTMKESFFRGMDTQMSKTNNSYCYSLIHDWLYSSQSNDLHIICREVEEELHLPQRFDKLEVEDLLTSECFPCINERILSRFLTEIGENIIKIDAIQKAVEKRRALVWYEPIKPYFDGILQISCMEQFRQAHAGGFHIVEASAIWKKYTADYYRMDSYYRRFYLAFGDGQKNTNTELEDAFKGASDYVENLYRNWYLEDLASQWTPAIKDDYSAKGELSDIRRQNNFYLDEVESPRGSSRVYVIISDGLRYELAAELADQLTAETKGSTDIASCQAVFPTRTEYGMAALLPHKRLGLDNQLNVMADDLPTGGLLGREKVLLSHVPDSVALTSERLIQMKKEERRNAVNSKSIVYIYHDVIDKSGESEITDFFADCEKAIVEIKNLVRIITGDLGGTNIIITSDHGFIYTNQALTESNKAEKSLISGDLFEYKSRYAIASSDAEAEHMITVSMQIYNRPDLIGFAPQDYIRFKKPGGSSVKKYMHGGLSLQELVVPIIHFKNLKTSSKKYVETQKVSVVLMTQSRKISNSIFSLDFYQQEPTGGKMQPITLEIYMADSAGRPVSDKQTLIADRTSEVGKDRQFRLQFNLRNMTFAKTDTYSLMMIDKEPFSLEPIQPVEFTIDISFTSDFEF